MNLLAILSLQEQMKMFMLDHNSYAPFLMWSSIVSHFSTLTTAHTAIVIAIVYYYIQQSKLVIIPRESQSFLLKVCKQHMSTPSHCHKVDI